MTFLIRKSIIWSYVGHHPSSPNSLLSDLKYGACLHLTKVTLGWGWKKGRQHRLCQETQPGPKRCPRMEVGGINWKLASHRPERLRVGKAYSEKQSKAH